MNAAKWTVAALAVSLCPILIYAAIWYSMVSREVALRNGVEAQQLVVENRFDTCWKTIKQTAQISDKARDSFEKVYKEIMQAKGMDKGGTFMKWITEAAPPTFDINKNFERLTTIVESQRASLEMEQKQLVSVWQEHKTLLDGPMGQHFLRGKKPINIVIISSDRAKDAVKTGIDNDTSL